MTTLRMTATLVRESSPTPIVDPSIMPKTEGTAMMANMAPWLR